MTAFERIATMMKIEQLELFRQARNLTYSEASELFDQYNVWTFIDEAYEGFHVQGANATHEDLLYYLETQKAVSC